MVYVFRIAYDVVDGVEGKSGDIVVAIEVEATKRRI